MAKDIISEDGSVDNEALDAAITTAYEDLHDPIPDPEKKTDKTSGDEKKPVTEKTASAEEASDGETDGDEDWMLADDVRELIDSLGLSNEEAKEFTGPDELQRHARFLDKQLREQGRKLAERERPGDEQEKALDAQDEAEQRMKLKERAERQTRGEDGKFKSNGDESYKPSLDKDYYDQEIVKEFERMSEFYEGRMKKLEEVFQQQSVQENESFHRSQVQAFDSIVDALGYEDLFGKSEDVRRDSPEWEGRIRLWEATNEVMAGIEAIRGVSPEMAPAIVKRALRAEFAKELESKQHKSFIQKIQKQSQRKLGGGRMRVDSERPYEGPPEKDPVLIQAYQQLEKEGGVA